MPCKVAKFFSSYRLFLKLTYRTPFPSLTTKTKMEVKVLERWTTMHAKWRRLFSRIFSLSLFSNYTREKRTVCCWHCWSTLVDLGLSICFSSNGTLFLRSHFVPLCSTFGCVCFAVNVKWKLEVEILSSFTLTLARLILETSARVGVCVLIQKSYLKARSILSQHGFWQRKLLRQMHTHVIGLPLHHTAIDVWRINDAQINQSLLSTAVRGHATPEDNLRMSPGSRERSIWR